MVFVISPHLIFDFSNVPPPNFVTLHKVPPVQGDFFCAKNRKIGVDKDLEVWYNVPAANWRCGRGLRLSIPTKNFCALAQNFTSTRPPDLCMCTKDPGLTNRADRGIIIVSIDRGGKLYTLTSQKSIDNLHKNT